MTVVHMFELKLINDNHAMDNLLSDYLVQYPLFKEESMVCMN